MYKYEVYTSIVIVDEENGDIIDGYDVESIAVLDDEITARQIATDVGIEAAKKYKEN